MRKQLANKMRDLTPEEQQLWNRVTNNVTRFGDARRPGLDVPFQILDPLPSWILDLHGMTVFDAFNNTVDFIENAYWASVRRVTIITGRSGAIREEFTHWINRYPVHSYELLNGGGCFRVMIMKKPQKTVTKS